MRKITEKSLENAAYYYLQRFSSSEGNLRSVLKRKVYKHHLKTGDSIPDQVDTWIEEVISKSKRLGYVDDQSYADGKIQGLLARGKSLKYIYDYLYSKHISADVIESLLNQHFKGEDIETGEYQLEAAIKHARKKRLGDYRIKALPEDYQERQKILQKEIGSLARAGFPIDIALKVINN